MAYQHFHRGTQTAQEIQNENVYAERRVRVSAPGTQWGVDRVASEGRRKKRRNPPTPERERDVVVSHRCADCGTVYGAGVRALLQEPGAEARRVRRVVGKVGSRGAD